MRKEIIKSVSFNVKDPDQMELLNHANTRSSFSGYVKRLIQRDMEGGGRVTTQREEKHSYGAEIQPESFI
jgi:hypothetical protein